MPRPADQIFLKLAVQQGALGQQDADDVWGELLRLEAEGAPSKARILCTELGFIDDELGKQLKQKVRSYLERKEEEVQADSRSERRIAGFELMERLGSGAMGVVFRARHLKLDKIVALKVLNPDFATDERYVARFMQEARVAAALNHPAIVQAYDVGQAGDVHYIAMEFVDGKTVKELIERRGRLDEQAAVEIVLQVLDALKHAHGRSLIHRDIKPANIIIGRDGRAKVLDLGLAKRTDVESGLTGEGRAIGTPYFMAPEQALDKGADYRSDIYSLGATFYNMVTGDKPYVAGTPVAVMNMHLKAPIPDAHEVVPEVSAGLAKIIKKMLAKRPADRYQDHDALTRDLEAVLAGLMPELDGGAPPAGIDHIASRPTPTTRRPTREKEGGGRGLLVAAAAAACLVGGGLLMARARDQEPGRPGVTDEVATETAEPAVREQAARAALDEVLKPSSASSRPQASKKELAEDLKQVADSFAGTQAGNDAYAKAQQLLKELSGEEAGRFERRSSELMTFAMEGRLLEAQSGWRELARTLEDSARRERAESEAKGLEQRIAALVVEGRRAADEHEKGGREDEAVRSLRRILDYLPTDVRALTEGRIDELTLAWSKRQRDAKRDTEEKDLVVRSADQERVDALGGKLRDLVRSGRASDALAEARRAADEVKEPTLAERAARHLEALTAALSLGDLGRQAFARLPADSDVSFHRRGGAAVDGKVAGVTGSGRLQVKLRAQGAETDVAAEDIEEQDLLRLIRKGLGANHPPYHLAVAALKLYRGDADAADALARAKEAGVDLAPLKAELDLAAGAPSDGQVPSGPNPGTDRPSPNPVQPTADQERERKLDDLARRVSAQQRRMFAEADQALVGRTSAAVTLEAVWDFQKLRQFGPVDWRLVEGQTHPAPAGSERRGLILDGRGRAELVCPSEGDFEVAIFFLVSGTFRPQESRLQLSAEGKEKDGRRVTCDMGQLVLWSKNKPKNRAGDSKAGELRSGTTSPYDLRLERVGKRFTSSFNKTVVGQLTTEDEPGEVKLVLEWANAPVDVLGLQVNVTPTAAWLEARLSDLGKQ